MGHCRATGAIAGAAYVLGRRAVVDVATLVIFAPRCGADQAAEGPGAGDHPRGRGRRPGGPRFWSLREFPMKWVTRRRARVKPHRDGLAGAALHRPGGGVPSSWKRARSRPSKRTGRAAGFDAPGRTYPHRDAKGRCVEALAGSTGRTTPSSRAWREFVHCADSRRGAGRSELPGSARSRTVSRSSRVTDHEALEKASFVYDALLRSAA